MPNITDLLEKQGVIAVFRGDDVEEFSINIMSQTVDGLPKIEMLSGESIDFEQLNADLLEEHKKESLAVLDDQYQEALAANGSTDSGRLDKIKKRAEKNILNADTVGQAKDILNEIDWDGGASNAEYPKTIQQMAINSQQIEAKQINYTKIKPLKIGV